MKVISLITCSFNSEATIEKAINSAQLQSYQHLQHVFIDGASEDATTEIIKQKAKHSDVILSEPDNGIYNAFNKGIDYSTGDIIGFLHSDDQFASRDVLKSIAEAFKDDSIEAVYGDLVFVKTQDCDHVLRYWKGGDFAAEKLLNGWMPPHPTLFVRRDIAENLRFDEGLKISADYDFILRFFLRNTPNVMYLPFVFVKMTLGGESTKSLSNVMLKMYEDYQIIKRAGLSVIRVLLLKNLRKLPQLWPRTNL